MLLRVVLDGAAPWGFRLVGGQDFNQPLTVAKILSGSKASRVNLCPGDFILAIDGVPTENMTHSDAQNLIKDATCCLTLTVERPETKTWSPSVNTPNKSHQLNLNLMPEREESRPIGTGHNRRAPPFIASASIDETRQVVSPTYNSPIGLYSSDNIQDALQKQLQSLSLHRNESPRCLGSIEESDVYQLLKKNQEEEHEPRQSGSFKALQSYVYSDDAGPAVIRKASTTIAKASAPLGNLHKLPVCDKCGNGIIGMVVKVQDKCRHPDCFVCSQCEENLKQKDYYFIDDELYCEIHAHARGKPPESPDL